MLKEKLIERARNVHGDKYDYSKAESCKTHDKVTIICPIHGEFRQTWDSHIRGNKCPSCGGVKKKTTEEFIKEYKEKCPNNYDLSKVVYVNAKTKVCLICPEHGEFFTTPHSLLANNNGCPKCGHNRTASKRRKTQDEIISKIKEIHGDKYDLSKVEYKNMYTKIELICPKHGSFWMRPHNLIDGKQGCPKCGRERVGEKERLTTEEFIKRARKVHGDKYDYSKVDYKDGKTKVCIICHNIDNITGNEHGEFWQNPSDHLSGCGCSKCSNKFNYTVDEYIEKANIIHNGKYDYSKLGDKFTSYAYHKITVICPEHGEFKIKPYSHLTGVGCPLCNESHLEKEIAALLSAKDISFERQKKFKWLGRKTIDFYLPDKNIGIECQGIQHFKIDDFFGGEEGFKTIVKRDTEKRKICEEHNVKILYYTDVKLDEFPYKVIKDKDTLINIIQE